MLAPLLVLAGLGTTAVPVLVPPVLAQLAQGPQAGQGGEPQVRVLLAEEASLNVAATDHPLALRTAEMANAQPLLLEPGESINLTLVGGQLQLQRAGGTMVIGARELWLEPLASGLSIGLSKPLGDFYLGQRGYHGGLQVLIRGSKLLAINHLGLESYLPSVVGSEMPASWPQAALRAQAVAARTYVLRQRSNAELFDVRATVASQVYKGVESETPSTLEAVASTRGQVLMYGGSLVNAVFHSSSGGSTENSGDLWSQQLPYLVSVPDVDQDSPVSHWQQRLEPEGLRKAFGDIGGATRIEILSTTSTGRVRQARVVGPAGTLVLTGGELRSRLGLRSTMVRFELVAPQLASSQLPGDSPPQGETSAPGPLDPPPLPAAEAQPPIQVPQPTWLAIGRGFGHGVGMSQWGAYALAQRGQDYGQILRYYFRGTDLRPYAAP